MLYPINIHRYIVDKFYILKHFHIPFTGRLAIVVYYEVIQVFPYWKVVIWWNISPFIQYTGFTTFTKWEGAHTADSKSLGKTKS